MVFPTYTVDQGFARPICLMQTVIVLTLLSLLSSLMKSLRLERTFSLRGAQATMLDIDHGTHPFVTSSNCTAGGAVTGSGVQPTLTASWALQRHNFTRLALGPFPSEPL